ncbi:MAG: YceD family protein [Pyrinomonadaceae bacterium]
MLIDLASVGTSPKKLKTEFAGSLIDLDGEGEVAGDAAFDGQTFRDGQRVHISGMIAAEVAVQCTRCLEPLKRKIEVAFDDVFVDSAHESRGSETELTVADMDEALVIGGRIDLADVVREQILLALPEQVFCQEDCRGLCPKCGGNRNLIDCNCEREEIDPRWAALKNLN